MWFVLSEKGKEIRIEVNDPEKAEKIIDKFLNDGDVKKSHL